jgi:ketosteroid isomerase-like protein
MSDENVQVVRASFDAWNNGGLSAWARFLASDVEWRLPPDAPEPGPYIGREAVLRQVRQQRDTWDADTAEPLGDFIESGPRPRGRQVRLGCGRGRGPQMDLPISCVYTVRAGKINEFEFFWDHAEALRAVGLSE